MSTTLESLAARPDFYGPALSLKHDHRREQLADAALATMAELGYARTSLREIAANSPFSHGVVHYYFASKAELISFCLRHYKARCVRRYDEVVATSLTGEALAAGFIDKLIESLVTEAPMHRLWYDARSASMFEPELREAVIEINGWLEDMVRLVLDRFCELADVRLAHPVARAYAILDGLFEAALMDYTLGDSELAVANLRDAAIAVLPTLVTA